MLNEINGYSLFNDVESIKVRTFNRARVMFNMMEDNMDVHTQLLTSKGKRLVTKYFEHIPSNEREDVYNTLEELMKKEGYISVQNG